MTDPMSPEELRACRERAEAATAGPWRAGSVERDAVFIPWPQGMGPERVLLRMNEHYPHDADAAFIAHARTDVPRLLATVATRDEEIRRIAEAIGRMREADGHAPFPASADELVRRAEELTRAEEERGDARAALSEHRHAALFAAGIHGGPGAWRWASDPTGTILDDAEAWERLLCEMRVEWSERNAPNAATEEPEGPGWAMGYTDETGTVVVEYCERTFESKSDAEECLSHAPMGLWYWEGAIRAIECRDGDYDSEAVGRFMPTTARLVGNGEAPGGEEP